MMKNRMVGGIIGGLLAGVTMPFIGPFAALVGAFSALAIANTMEACAKRKALPRHPISNATNPVQSSLSHDSIYCHPDIRNTFSGASLESLRQNRMSLSDQRAGCVSQKHHDKIRIDSYGRIFDPDDE